MYIKVGSQNDALNLSNLLKDGDWMVLYYAEWCGHCNTMKPEWQKVVNKMNKNNSINVAEIESTHIDDLTHKPKIDGFPTIKMYNNGNEVAKFDDERIADNIEKFAINNSNNSKKNTKVKKQRKRKVAAKPKTMKILNNLPLQKNEMPMDMPMDMPVEMPVEMPMEMPVEMPTDMPAEIPTEMPTEMPIEMPTEIPTESNIDLLKNNNIFNEKPKNSSTECSKHVIPKICKSTNNCMFDYNIKKCIEKPNLPKSTKPKKTILKTQKTKSPTKTPPKLHTEYTKTRSPRAPRTHKKPVPRTKSNSNSNSNNIRKTTKSVFTKLIDSFQRIGKEAETDAQLLREAKHLL